MRTRTLRYAIAVWVLAALTLTAPAGAQSSTDREKMTAQSELALAEAAFSSAEAAGAATLATNLYDEARTRLVRARANWNDSKRSIREDAALLAVEARHAARAAEAQALLIATNTEVRNLRKDITGFGGTPVSVDLYDPPATVSRGITSLDRVIVAENALATARAVGGELVASDDLKQAEATLKTARMLAKNQKQSASADHLSFVAEMLARRAEYVARRNGLGPQLPSLRAERTRMAKEITDARAREEQNRRLEAERQAAELRRQLDAVSANRQAEREELERLRDQVAMSDAQTLSQLQADRAARVEAERNFDELQARYQQALVDGSATSIQIEELRRQVEDQSLALQAIQNREIQSESTLSNQVSSLEQALEQARANGQWTADALAQREQEIQQQRNELQRLRGEREEAEKRRAELESTRTAAIAEAERRRSEAEAQTMQLRQEVATERARAEQAAAELARTREELARRDAAAQQRIETMQQELSKLAATRTSDRGFIVTLPGLFFDSGKSVLKSGAKNTLAKIADQLRTTEGLRIAVEGHTDSVGSEAMNQTLSEKRAAAVRDYLVSRGIAATQITTTGLGETSPVATNDTAAGRQQNRRVELVIAK